MRDDHRLTDEAWESCIARARGTPGDCETTDADRGSLIADGGVSLSKLMDVLSDERRRSMLYYLRREESAELEDVIEQIGARESGVPPEKLDEETKQNIRIDLYHRHMPKLEDAGIVEYDRLSGLVRFQHPPDGAENLLDYSATVDSHEESRKDSD